MSGTSSVERTATIAKMVFLTAKDTSHDELRSLLEATRQQSLLESGTVQWSLHVSDDDPRTFALYETFTNAAAVVEHDSSAAVANLVAGFGRCLATAPLAHLLRIE